MHVLLRSWPDPAERGKENVALEKLVTETGPALRQGDLYFVEDLKTSFEIYRVPDTPDLGADIEYRFEKLSQEAMGILRESGWDPVDCPCPTCPRK